MQIDTTCGDAELFLRYFCPNEVPDKRYLGDVWWDAPWRILCGVFEFNFIVLIDCENAKFQSTGGHAKTYKSCPLVLRFEFDSITAVITAKIIDTSVYMFA